MTIIATRTPDANVSFVSMLKHAVVDAQGKPLGRVVDAIVRPSDDYYPLLVGLVTGGGGGETCIPVGDVGSIGSEVIRVGDTPGSSSQFEPRESDIFLRKDVLGHRLLDIEHSALVRAYDVRLASTPEGWAAIGLDVHKHRWFHFGDHESHSARDWNGFLLLIGRQAALKNRFSNRVRSLKPAQLADIIESASSEEQGLLLGQLHADPELEADVFEELDEDKQSQLLKTRSDQDVADVLSRMRADDVADAVMELPQVRRRRVLDLLPQPQSAKVLALLGYNPATAGGLMGTDFLALPEDQRIADALEQLRASTTQQPEALTTIHSLRSDGTLAGTLGLVRALQLDPATLLRDAADPHLVAASPDDDVIAVTTRMADFNLLTLPVLDSNGMILGVVTVDDALEAAIPRDWYRRVPGHLSPRQRESPARHSTIDPRS